MESTASATCFRLFFFPATQTLSVFAWLTVKTRQADTQREKKKSSNTKGSGATTTTTLTRSFIHIHRHQSTVMLGKGKECEIQDRSFLYRTPCLVCKCGTHTSSRLLRRIVTKEVGTTHHERSSWASSVCRRCATLG